MSLQLVRLEEASYRVDARSLSQRLGGVGEITELTQSIVTGAIRDVVLAHRFESSGGLGIAQLGLWLTEVFGGPALFSLSFPDADLQKGPLPGVLLDLEDRARLIDVARDVLAFTLADRCAYAVRALQANLPLHPQVPSPTDRQLVPLVGAKDQRLSIQSSIFAKNDAQTSKVLLHCAYGQGELHGECKLSRS